MITRKPFDIIKYLNLYLEPTVKETAALKLLELLSQYLIIRTIELIPEDKLEGIDHPEQLFKLAKEIVPDFDDKVKQFLADFKDEYQQEAQTN